MSLKKRPEIIVLLLVVVAGGIWVFLSSNKPLDLPSNDAAGSSTPSASIEVFGMNLVRDFGNAKLTVAFKAENTSDNPQPLQPPFVRLVTAEGEEVAPFFLAFNQPPTLEPGTSKKVELSWWLEAAHLNQSIILHLGDKQAEIKNNTPVDLEPLANEKPYALKSNEWAF